MQGHQLAMLSTSYRSHVLPNQMALGHSKHCLCFWPISTSPQHPQPLSTTPSHGSAGTVVNPSYPGSLPFLISPQVQ